MAYDEDLAARIRSLLDARIDVEEKRMFGGLVFMIGGNMACGVTAEDLMVRVGRDASGALIDSEPGARVADMSGRPMRGWVLVGPSATADDAALEAWVRRGEELAAGLAPKQRSGA